MSTRQQGEGHQWFAAFWDWAVKNENAAIRRGRQETVGGATGRVLEIGCGTGANLPYYPDDLTAPLPPPHPRPRPLHQGGGVRVPGVAVSEAGAAAISNGPHPAQHQGRSPARVGVCSPWLSFRAATSSCRPPACPSSPRPTCRWWG